MGYRFWQMRVLLQLKDNSVFLQFYLSYLVLWHISIMLSKFRLSSKVAFCLALFRTTEEQGSCSKEAYNPRATMGATKLFDTGKQSREMHVKGCVRLWMERVSVSNASTSLPVWLGCAPVLVLLVWWGDVLPGWVSALGEVTSGSGAEPAAAVASPGSWKHEPAPWLCEMHSLPP